MSIQNFSGIILMLLIIYLLYHTYGTDQVGGDLKQMTISNLYKDPYYGRQYRELDDVDNVLNRPIHKYNIDIENLTASNIYRHTEQQLTTPIVTYLDFKLQPPPKKTSNEVLAIVEHKQPYFLDEALIIDKDGYKFYWDSRYPKQPISIEFAQDPEKYIQTRPNEYPSYVIASRNYSNMTQVNLLD
jgi:hypothetical protein